MTRHWRHASVGCAVLAIVVAGRVASAAPGFIMVDGEAAADRRATVLGALGEATASAGWSGASVKLTQAESAELLQCANTATPWSCIPAAFGKADVHRMLVVTVDQKPGEGGEPIIVLSGKLITTAPDAFTVRQRFCEHCSDERLTTEASQLATQMLRDVAVRQGRTAIVIRSEPPGAQISLDGERIGVTNSTYKTYPGQHVLTIEKAGYATETRQVDVEEGASREVDVTLHAATAPGAGTAEARPSRLVPAIVVGAGVTALVAGIVIQATADGPPLGEPQPSRIYSAPGIGLAVAGGVVAGVGVYLWTRATRGSTGGAAPTVSLTEHGGMLGWSQSY